MSQHEETAAARTVLVVHEEAGQRHLLAEYVREAGLEPLSCSNAEDALAALKPENPPALILTDLCLPGLGGWQFCRLLRTPEFAAYNQVPLLVVSSDLWMENPAQMAVDLGVDVVLQFPPDGDRMVQCLRGLARGERRAPALRALLAVGAAYPIAGLEAALETQGYAVDLLATGQEAAAPATVAYDVALIDAELPEGRGEALLKSLNKQQPGCLCVMLADRPNSKRVMDWLKQGAIGFVRPPPDPAGVLDLCARARKERTRLRIQETLVARATEREQTEEALLRQADFTRRILNSTDAHLAVVDAQGAIIDVNDAWTHFARQNNAGDESTWGVGANYFRGFSPAAGDTSCAAEAFEGIRQVQQGKRLFFEIEYPCHATSTQRWFSMRVLPFQGRPGSVLISHVNITAQKTAEESLRESEARQHALLEALPDMMFLFDRNGIFIDYHTPEQTSLLMKPETFLGRSAHEVLPRPIGDMVQSHIQDLLQNGRTSPFAYEARLGAELRFYESRMVLSSNGKVLAMVTDVTERKRAELEREKLLAQLTQAQKMESVGRLAGGIAHDFNNMLGVILGHAELAMLQVEDRHPLYQDLKSIAEAAQRSSELTRQLLAFARKQKTTPQELAINQTVEGMLRMLRRLMGEAIELQWHPCPESWRVHMDPSQVDQLLVNLVVNARDAIGEKSGGRITIQTSNVTLQAEDCREHPDWVLGEYVRIDVRDNGCGMDKATLEHIFEPFFTTKEEGRGTGLGLATVYGVVKQNNGHITVVSTPEQGTEFRIFLPRLVRKAGKKDAVAAHTPLSGSETVLLVEDEPSLLLMTQTMLERLGYRVVPALSPREALDWVEKRADAIDLLMADVIMPSMNGLDLARKLSEHRQGLKCLFMSGYTNDFIHHFGVLEKGTPFIRKPFSINDLGVKVREVLGSR